MPKTIDWDAVIKLWAHGRPESTLYVYRPVIADFRNFVQQTPIDKVTLAMLQDFQDKWKKQQPATVQRKMATIASVLNFAHKMGVLNPNPATMLRLPKVPDDLAKKILAQKQILKMIEMEPAPRNKVLMRVMYCSGIRAAEASRLRWVDCRDRGKGGIITVLGKGNKKRSILLAPEVWKWLKDLRPPQARGEEWVFLNENGFTPITRMHITNIIRQAAERAGIEARVTAHWMRHAHATHAMDAGAPLPLISQTLGHASMETTARYLHVNPEKSSAKYISLVG